MVRTLEYRYRAQPMQLDIRPSLRRFTLLPEKLRVTIMHHKFLLTGCLILVLGIGTQLPWDYCSAWGQESPRFHTLVLNEEFHSEGAAVADIDGDGSNDIISGPFWYRGPQFRERHAYALPRAYSIGEYSAHFFSFVDDFNQDGRPDILSIPIPGGKAVWYENPEEHSELWEQHTVLNGVDNESPTFADLTGDGRNELICIHQGEFGFAQPNVDSPNSLWQFTPISKNYNRGKFTHGLGIGDVDGDGRQDILESNGWWQQPETPGSPFSFHETKFAESGGSQMFAYDVDGDGDNDVISVQNAHGFGLCWFERRGSDGDFLFVRHQIMGDQPQQNRFGLVLTQMHALGMADIDGDGVQDIVTGKRYYAHGGRDPGAHQLPLLVWFKTIRTGGKIDFVPHVIHRRSGVGTQVTIHDIDGNRLPDIVVGNKLGTFVSLNLGLPAGTPDDSLPATSAPFSLVGTDEFAKHVRDTDPRSAETEKSTFTLPIGFEVQLVAAEPDIAKPMNLAFDSRGRLWVSSSREYPLAAPAEREPQDTIKILEDLDGDGTADKITTFADGLNIPIGLYPYLDGVICFSIPNILYLRDTDGDSKSDERIVLYGPMDTSRDTHGMCNAFMRGLDGWLYACHGFNNQSTVAGHDGHQITMRSGNTFRMRLDGSRIEHYTHGQVNPFGMELSNNGDIFTADCHTKPITLLLQGGYSPSFGAPHDGLGFVPPVMNHLHGSTAIAGIALCQSSQFPPAFRDSALGGNVMTSRVNRNSLTYIGSTVQAKEEPDFLVSGDPWFRPVDLQIGPDGALYVADFYNRIIGHYEVPLAHPGRDRHRGRIWRVIYTGSNDRRDVPETVEVVTPTESADTRRYESMSMGTALQHLRSDNLSVRMAASDRLADHFGLQALDAVRSRFDARPSDIEKIHLAWILLRLDGLRDQDLESLLASPAPLTRVHAYRLLNSLPESNKRHAQMIRQGLQDSDALVRRCAAMAATQHRELSLIQPLLKTLQSTPSNDVHLQHALRMALRDQLTNRDWFLSTTGGRSTGNSRQLDKSEIAIISELCLAIRTDFAAEFVVQHLASSDDIAPDSLVSYIAFASTHAPIDQIPDMVALAQERFADDGPFQERLAVAIRDGIKQRGESIPPPLMLWATDLASARLGLKPNDPDTRVPSVPTPIVWTYVPISVSNRTENPWVASTRRSAADGQHNVLLHSSFPKGERHTGIFRSGSFALPETFRFYLAGHDGSPDKPLQRKNWVRVRDTKSKTILKEWSPPRNDKAQAIDWATGDHAGTRVYLELVDGDGGSAYAWLAAGRFSVTELNPSETLNEWRQGAELAEDFELDSLRPALSELLGRPNLDRVTTLAVAKALVGKQGSAVRIALAESLGVSGVSGNLRKAIIQQIIQPIDLRVETELILQVLSIASSVPQRRLAEILASDHDGADALLNSIHLGRASPTLLNYAAVAAKLTAVADAAQTEQIAALTTSLLEVDPTVLEKTLDRANALRSGLGSRDAGKQLFDKNCSACHQVAGQGQQVGPNLDGIGNRGLQRLIEDVFIPNQNIDIAFRASLLLTADGKVYTGFVKQAEGARLTLIDSQGKETQIDVDSIERRTITNASPMASNFAETLSVQQCRDLFAYLMSLNR